MTCFICNNNIPSTIVCGFDKKFCSLKCRRKLEDINTYLDTSYTRPDLWIQNKFQYNQHIFEIRSRSKSNLRGKSSTNSNITYKEERTIKNINSYPLLSKLCITKIISLFSIIYKIQFIL